jgi:hypothetical protein
MQDLHNNTILTVQCLSGRHIQKCAACQYTPKNCFRSAATLFTRETLQKTIDAFMKKEWRLSFL